MIEAYRQFWQKYTQTKGRTSRKVFWQTIGMHMVIVLSLCILLFFGVMLGSRILFTIVYLLYLLFGLAILIPNITMSIRRLNDSGKEWTYLFVLFIPIAGPIWFLVLVLQPSKKRRKRKRQ